jgi:HEAT repeat protein/prolyl-tRNA editing enzyme YbaK/EbsC (Cys-tRNA(Pro) deacylase)
MAAALFGQQTTLKSGRTYSIEIHSAASTQAAHIFSCGAKRLTKTLHLGDKDWSFAHRPATDCRIRVMPAQARIKVVDLGVTTSVELEPNDTWLEATAAPLGGVMFATGDDSLYLPSPLSKRGKPTEEFQPRDVDWYRIQFAGGKPRLVSFQIELMDRDNLPVDVSVFRIVDGKPVLFTEGEDPVSMPHEVQALPGNKYTTRVLKDAGDYYVRVVANHPEYRLRTRTYDTPPYADPEAAVRAGVDYLIGSGESWHANTPRRGGVFDRVANVHQETSLCVACHVTHFTQRAQLYAARQGYPVELRNSQHFLAERFYNNPRPFYGFEEHGAVWARVISAPANVLGRMAHLLDVYEKQITGGNRGSFHDGVKKYLKLYYDGRTQLPADETNGNQPLVSTYEVAWYAWEITRDPAIAALIEQDEHKNLADLCYQTLALAAMDKTRHAAKIARNAERILKLQRESGQWSMKFEAKEKDVEFQTGHALWALAAAGVPRDNPQVAKGLKLLLDRQQDFGGWLDPLQSFENFRTPFRETQMAVLALSAYYPRAGAAKPGWGSTVSSLPEGGDALLAALDQIWDRPVAPVLQQVRGLTRHPSVLVRQLAVEVLGRLSREEDLDVLHAALNDGSKLVRRTAAWAIRTTLSERSRGNDKLLAAFASRDERVELGVTRVFANHFRELARDDRFAAALLSKTRSASIPVRLQAWKGLWQFWFWTPSDAVKNQIEDAFLAALKQAQHPWVESNLREGLYNLADENIRYLYNNWVPLLPRSEDRERAIRGRLKHEDRMATKFARFLQSESNPNRKRLLAALTEFHLRRADAYDLKADPHAPAPPIYNRIGNDIEQIVFFGQANGRLAAALLPLVESNDPELRRLAMQGVLMVRDAKFGEVVKVSGPAGPARDKLVEVAKRNPADETNLEVLRAFHAAPPKPPMASQNTASSSGRVLEKPDESYFRGYVQPILEKRGKDGYACVQCHASHAIFNGTWATALNVVNLENPEESLILKKPTSSAETEGVAGSKATAHGGGVRFEKDSPEYNTILNWIRGAKP